MSDRRFIEGAGGVIYGPTGKPVVTVAVKDLMVTESILILNALPSFLEKLFPDPSPDVTFTGPEGIDEDSCGNKISATLGSTIFLYQFRHGPQRSEPLWVTAASYIYHRSAFRRATHLATFTYTTTGWKGCRHVD